MDVFASTGDAQRSARVQALVRDFGELGVAVTDTQRGRAAIISHGGRSGHGIPAAIGHTTGTRPETRFVKVSQKPMIMPLAWINGSGRRESDPHDQLGRSVPQPPG